MIELPARPAHVRALITVCGELALKMCAHYQAAPTANGSAQQAAPGAQFVATSALPAGSLFPWLSDPAASMSHGSTSSSQPPMASPQQQHRPQPRSGVPLMLDSIIGRMLWWVI